jgi:hypothetical protein
MKEIIFLIGFGGLLFYEGVMGYALLEPPLFFIIGIVLSGVILIDMLRKNRR